MRVSLNFPEFNSIRLTHWCNLVLITTPTSSHVFCCLATWLCRRLPMTFRINLLALRGKCCIFEDSEVSPCSLFQTFHFRVYPPRITPGHSYKSFLAYKLIQFLTMALESADIECHFLIWQYTYRVSPHYRHPGFLIRASVLETLRRLYFPELWPGSLCYFV